MYSILCTLYIVKQYYTHCITTIKHNVLIYIRQYIVYVIHSIVLYIYFSNTLYQRQQGVVNILQNTGGLVVYSITND